MTVLNKYLFYEKISMIVYDMWQFCWLFVDIAYWWVINSLWLSWTCYAVICVNKSRHDRQWNTANWPYARLCASCYSHILVKLCCNRHLVITSELCYYWLWLMLQVCKSFCKVCANFCKFLQHFYFYFITAFISCYFTCVDRYTGLQ